MALNPCARESMATNTPTVPAMPSTATIDEFQRCLDAAQVVSNRYRHHTLLSASTTRRRIAPIAGMMPLMSPTVNARANPMTSAVFGTLKNGRHVGQRDCAKRQSSWPPAMPSPPPISEISNDSAMTKNNTKRSENPTAFKTASSPVRSRTAMAMVLPVISSKVKKTTLPMVMIRN